MPVKSKAQMRLMFAVASGKAKKKPKGLSKKEAKDMLAATENKSALPEKPLNQRRRKERRNERSRRPSQKTVQRWKTI